MSAWLDPRGCRSLLRQLGERSAFLSAQLKAAERGQTHSHHPGRRRRFIVRQAARIGELALIVRTIQRLQRPARELQPYKDLVQRGSPPPALPVRQRLRPRRVAITETIAFQRSDGGEASFDATIGFDQLGRPKEIFLSGARDGSDMAAMLADCAVALSVALQHGVPAETMAMSTARIGGAPGSNAGQRASIVGAALDLLVKYEREVPA